jgi:hypothetical protein
MLKPNPDTWIAWLFICAFGLVFVFSFWHHIVIAVVLYALAQGFTSPHHHSNRRRTRCGGRRRCRQWWEW